MKNPATWLSLAALCLAATGSWQRAPSVEAERFVVTDDRGRTRALLGLDEASKEPVLQLMDKDGAVVLNVSLQKGTVGAHSRIEIVDSSGSATGPRRRTTLGPQGWTIEDAAGKRTWATTELLAFEAPHEGKAEVRTMVAAGGTVALSGDRPQLVFQPRGGQPTVLPQ